MKTCSKCGVPKEEAEFLIRSDTKELGGSCRCCRAEYQKGYNETLRAVDSIAAATATRNWRGRNPGSKKARLQADPQFRLVENLRRRVNHAVCGTGSGKSAKTKALLGCPWVWLEVHLESLFRPGMTWENYGPVWHVDHIKPCSAFNLLDPEQQRVCFHWTNLQPLFAKENLQKSDKYPLTS